MPSRFVPHALLLASLLPCLALPGCGPDRQPAYMRGGQATTDADACRLSGGKVHSYVPMPGLPADPTAKELLQACRFYTLPSTTARSAAVEFKTRLGLNHAHALVVGDLVLVDPGDVMRQGFGTGADPTQKYHNGPDRKDQWQFGFPPPNIIITANSKWATVGERRILLKNPVVAVYPISERETHLEAKKSWPQAVMTWSDLLALLKAHDALYMPGGGQSIHDGSRLIYNMWDAANALGR